MSRIIEIPGGSATIREPKDVKQRARRRLELASILASPIFTRINEARKDRERELGHEVKPEDVSLIELGLSRDDFDAMYEVQTATILAYLESWTLDRELPRSAEDLDDLPSELYDALRTGTARDGADAVAPVDFSPNPDPTLPTGDPSGSDKPLRASAESVSTTRSESTGGSSAIESSSEALTTTI